MSGCSAIRTMRGVPAAYMPHEFQAESREGKCTIDLSLLQRSQPDQYRIEAGDVLAVYAPGLLGLVNTQPDQPNGDSPPINMPSNPSDKPSVGFPVPVRDDHTIQLPQLPAINVYGLTVRQTEERLRQAAISQGLLADDTPTRLVVDILRHRTYRVMVYRQEPNSGVPMTSAAGTINLGAAGRGTSRIVELRAYENDVAHALAQPGVEGLPGLDARNVIYIIRSRTNGQSTNPAPLAPSSDGMVIRGQNPSGWQGRTTSQTTPGQGPYDYMTTSRFQLSGGDVSRGYTGPPLETGVPAGHSIAGGHSAMPRSAAGRFPASPNTRDTRWAPTSPPNPYHPVQYTSPVYDHEPTYAIPPNHSGLAPTPLIAPGQPTPYAVPPSMMAGRDPVPVSPQPEPLWTNALQQFDSTIAGEHVVKIPVRLAPGETLDLTEEDITLYDGDIVFIESRETDVYYIGGLLGGGQFTLPRDKDLRVLEALSLAQGQSSSRSGSPGMQSSGGVSALNRDVTPSASRLLIIRKVTGQQVQIEVDLYKALKYPHENIVVQPGDLLLLQYTPCEAIGAFFQRNLFEGALLGIAAGSLRGGS